MHKSRLALCVGVLVVLSRLAQAQPIDARAPAATLLKAARLLDVESGRYLPDHAILIEHSKITQMGPVAAVKAQAPPGTVVLDLGKATLLPGLIDCHSHLMMRSVNRYATTLATKSLAMRALEGAASARDTLRAGFTTVRDVGNEGAGYADVALRDAIQKGLVEGPRMLVATRAIAALGQYHPFHISPDLIDFPTGAEEISGVEEARRAVRKQIKFGADLIKVYADWEYPTLTVAEMAAIVEEAHKAGRKVAAHATTPVGIRNAVSAGVDSIEHGDDADRAGLEMMRQKGTYLVVTASGYEASPLRQETPSERAASERRLAMVRRSVAMALQLGVLIASGYDAADEAEQGHNVEHIIALTHLGISPIEALRASTLRAAQLLGWADKVGRLKVGHLADVIAVSGDPLTDISELKRVMFVMKDGAVVLNRLPQGGPAGP